MFISPKSSTHSVNTLTPASPTCDIIHSMKFCRTSRIDDENVDNLPFPQDETDQEDSTIIKTVGWVSAGLGAVALGLFIGRELRQRYQFNRRTPYDFYAHSGDEQDVDFPLGI